MTRPGKSLALFLLLATPALTFAHSPVKGVGTFYNGLLHPVFVPAHILLIIAFGLFLGQKGAVNNRAAIVAFWIATAAGLIAAWFPVTGAMEPYLLSAAALTGLLIASNLPVPPFWCSLAAVMVGLLLGMDSTQETLLGSEKLIALLGCGIGINILVLFPTALADCLNEKAWQKIGVRIIGSWVAASAMLVLALSFASA
jgi:hydrogenase/urease accessory protein HupE